MKVKMNIDTTITNFPITKVWKKGKKAVKEGKRDEARDFFDMGIVMVAKLSMDKNDCGDDFIIEGTTRKLWLTRFWKVGLENNNLLL
jgi:hypothetical protein